MSRFDPVFLDDWYLEMCICQIRAISIDFRFALDVLKREGAERVYFLATHGVFSYTPPICATKSATGSADTSDAVGSDMHPSSRSDGVGEAELRDLG